MSGSHRILLVEDDRLVAKTIRLAMQMKGLAVTVCECCADALAWLAQRKADLILLDVGLPDGNGIDLCRQIREADKHTPILLVTAYTDEVSAVNGFACGADDYIRKPFGTHELYARIRRMLERAPASSTTYAFGSLQLNAEKYEAAVHGVALNLGKREFQILASLMRRPGEVVRREALLSLTETDADIYDRTIDSHVSHLRRKLREANAAAQITAIYGVGYKLE